MENQTHREPTLYIVGNNKRCNEIKNIIENEWGGDNELYYEFDNLKFAYFINSLGYVDSVEIEVARNLSVEGWMKEYELPEMEKVKCEFKPFDKVVVRNPNREWCADLFSHVEKFNNGEEHLAVIGGCYVKECLPYNEDTAKLIGTNDDFDYDLITKK